MLWLEVMEMKLDVLYSGLGRRETYLIAISLPFLCASLLRAPLPSPRIVMEHCCSEMSCHR